MMTALNRSVNARADDRRLSAGRSPLLASDVGTKQPGEPGDSSDQYLRRILREREVRGLVVEDLDDCRDENEVCQQAEGYGDDGGDEVDRFPQVSTIRCSCGLSRSRSAG